MSTVLREVLSANAAYASHFGDKGKLAGLIEVPEASRVGAAKS